MLNRVQWYEITYNTELLYLINVENTFPSDYLQIPQFWDQVKPLYILFYTIINWAPLRTVFRTHDSITAFLLHTKIQYWLCLRRVKRVKSLTPVLWVLSVLFQFVLYKYIQCIQGKHLFFLFHVEKCLFNFARIQ